MSLTKITRSLLLAAVMTAILCAVAPIDHAALVNRPWRTTTSRSPNATGYARAYVLSDDCSGESYPIPEHHLQFAKAGLQHKGAWHVGVNECDDHPRGIQFMLWEGEQRRISSGWMGLACFWSPGKYRCEAFAVIAHDDLTGEDFYPLDEHPLGRWFEWVGQWHVGPPPGISDGLPRGVCGYTGRTVSSGWMALRSFSGWSQTVPIRQQDRKPDFVILLLHDDCTGVDYTYWPDEELSGYEMMDRWHVGYGQCDGLVRAVDYYGRTISSGWIGLAWDTSGTDCGGWQPLQ